MKFGDKLIEWMDAAGVSEPGLADAVGCHQGSVRNWMTGRCLPSVTQIARLADVLNVPEQDVLRAVLERETVDSPRP